jgi:hypothetical protein
VSVPSTGATNRAYANNVEQPGVGATGQAGVWQGEEVPLGIVVDVWKGLRATGSVRHG